MGSAWWLRSLDFSTNTFGDVGCHICDPAFDTLALTAPISVRSEDTAPNRRHWGTRSLIHYVFRGAPHNVGEKVKVTWYDGGQKPPAEIRALLGVGKISGQGSILVGANG